MFEEVFIKNTTRDEILNRPEYGGQLGKQKFLDCGDKKSKNLFPWDSVVNRVQTYCQKKQKGASTDNDICLSNEYEYFNTLALALTKYDYHGATSNWDPSFKHEKTIYGWTKYCLIYKKVYQDHIESTIKDYNKGLIPDAHKLMFDYFT